MNTMRQRHSSALQLCKNQEERQTGGRQTDRWETDRRSRLCEDEAGLAVNLEDFLDGVDVRRRPQVQTQVVLVGCSHDLLHRDGGGGGRRR